MKSFWRRLEELVTKLKDRVVTDVFTSARIRILVLYFLVGLLILGIASWMVYSRVLYIVQLVIQIVQDAVLKAAINGDIATGAQSTGALAAATVNDELQRLIVAVGIWMIGSMLVSAYLLTDVTLRPIRRALESQKRFVANISHELRTPLSIMKTESEAALMDKTTTKEDLALTIQSNISEVDRMSRILQFLLNFSTFENRMKSLSMNNVNLTATVERCVKMMQPQATEKNISIEIFDEEEVPIVVWGNEMALEEMFTNLLKNSIRYTPEGGRVDIEIEKKLYGTIALSVKDKGIGIPKEDLPHIFEPFYKGKNVTTKRKDNAGLGLAIVKEIATFHNGTVSIHSVVGKGTKVTIRLPGERV